MADNNQEQQNPSKGVAMARTPDRAEVDRIGEAQRDYPHSSGDRNTKKSEADWPEFSGGEQRNADPGGDGADRAREG